MGKFSLKPPKHLPSIPPKATGPDDPPDDDCPPDEDEGNGEMASAGYPDADEPKAAAAQAPVEEPEYDEEMPQRFLTGGATAEEVAAWKEAHGKGKKGKKADK